MAKKKTTKSAKVARPSSYYEYYEKQKAAGKVKQVSYAGYTWEEEGQTLICQLQSYEDVESNEYDGTYRRYTVDTDSGEMTLSCGASFDQAVDENDLLGKIVAVEYLGKGQTRKGNEFNKFAVFAID